MMAMHLIFSTGPIKIIIADYDFVERALAGSNSLSSSYHDEILDDVTSIISPTEMLKIGLDLVGFTERRILQAYVVTMAIGL